MHRTILAIAATAIVPMLCLAEGGSIKVTESSATITLTNGEIPVLTYQKALLPPPEGEDPLYARSGFIHPLCAPSGDVLTGIHPDDHIHHVGVWHPWVNTQFRGHKVDFWNLKDGLGTVRYAKTLKVTPSGFSVEQEHLDLTRSPEPEVVLRETFSVEVRCIDGVNIIDYTTVQTNVTDAPLVLPQYRYGGGIAYRAPATWDKTNSDYLSSEGKNRDNGHTTRANWVAMFGPTEHGDSTLAILDHPSNHDHPQRLRVWPASSHNGAIFLNYCPVQETGWQIDPAQEVTMRYQIATFDGRPQKNLIATLWEKFAKNTPPQP